MSDLLTGSIDPPFIMPPREPLRPAFAMRLADQRGISGRAGQRSLSRILPAGHGGGCEARTDGWKPSFLFAVYSLASWRLQRARRRVPRRPVRRSGISEAQLTDLRAVQEGKITWAQYSRCGGGAANHRSARRTYSATVTAVSR